MVSLYGLIIFFFILVVLYSAISLILSLSGWLQKRWLARRCVPDPGMLAVIDERIDRLKTLTFQVVVPLALFGITPFVVVYLFIR